MDTLVNHFESYLGLYILLVIGLLALAIVLAIDLLSPRRLRERTVRRDIPDHTGTFYTHGSWAGTDESGPDIS